MQDESALIRRYLHPHSCPRFDSECHLWLVCDENIDFISDLCAEIVEREQWTGASRSGDEKCVAEIPRGNKNEEIWWGGGKIYLFVSSDN